MIQKKNNPTVAKSNFDLTAGIDGCCGHSAGVESAYITTTALTITEVTNLIYEKDGVPTTILIGEAITGNDVNEIHQAIVNALESPEPLGGGFSYNPGDVKVYVDPYNANKITIVILSNVVITSINVNNGTTLTFTASSTKARYCLYKFDYTNSDPISIVIDNVPLVLTSYANATLLDAAVDAQLDAQGFADSVSRTKAGSVAGHTDLIMWLKDVDSVYINGNQVARHHCEMKFFIAAIS